MPATRAQVILLFDWLAFAVKFKNIIIVQGTPKFPGTAAHMATRQIPFIFLFFSMFAFFFFFSMN